MSFYGLRVLASLQAMANSTPHQGISAEYRDAIVFAVSDVMYYVVSRNERLGIPVLYSTILYSTHCVGVPGAVPEYQYVQYFSIQY